MTKRKTTPESGHRPPASEVRKYDHLSAEQAAEILQTRLSYVLEVRARRTTVGKPPKAVGKPIRVRLPLEVDGRIRALARKAKVPLPDFVAELAGKALAVTESSCVRARIAQH